MHSGNNDNFKLPICAFYTLIVHMRLFVKGDAGGVVISCAFWRDWNVEPVNLCLPCNNPTDGVYKEMLDYPARDLDYPALPECTGRCWRTWAFAYD